MKTNKLLVAAILAVAIGAPAAQEKPAALREIAGGRVISAVSGQRRVGCSHRIAHPFA